MLACVEDVKSAAIAVSAEETTPSLEDLVHLGHVSVPCSSFTESVNLLSKQYSDRKRQKNLLNLC